MEKTNIIYGVIKVSSNGCWVGSTGIHEQYLGGKDEDNLILDFPINCVFIYMDDTYMGVVHLTPDSGFFFSRTTVKYEYYVDGKNLQLFFNKEEL